MKKFLMVAIAATAILGACKKPGEVNAELKNDADTLAYAIGVACNVNEDDVRAELQRNNIDTTAVEEFQKGFREALMKEMSDKERAYYLGYLRGLDLAMNGIAQVENMAFAGTDEHINRQLIALGMRDASKDAAVITTETFDTTTGKFVNKPIDSYAAGSIINDKANKLYKVANEKYIVEVSKKSGVKALGGNIYYKVITEGKGKTPTVDDYVSVSYVGSFINGMEFDNSHGQAVDFPVNGVIPGFTAALTKMKVGSEWEVYIPYQQGYGEQGYGRDIPPYSTLIFKLKLEDVKAAPEMPEMSMQPEMAMPY